MAKEKNKYFNFGYYQKSLSFLYPLLQFKKPQLFEPINTYLFCENLKESIIDYKLLVLFKYSEKRMFEEYEKNNILNHPNLENCYLLEDGVLYVFDLSSFKKTIDAFLAGEYSKFEKKDKDLILSYNKFFIKGKLITPEKVISDEVVITEGSLYPLSVLYPSEFKDLYIKALVSEFDIYDSEEEARKDYRDIKEIGSIYNLEKETLHSKLIERCS